MSTVLLPNAIIVNNGFGIELFIKGLYDYHKIFCLYRPNFNDKFTNDSLYSLEDQEHQNSFNFIIIPQLSDITYDELFTISEDDTDFVGSDVYIRKDSSIFNYVKNMSDYSEYINVNKHFVYFGKLYQNGNNNNEVSISTNFINNYVTNAIPETQRTNNVREFLGVCFDQVYSKTYNNMGYLLNLLDPMETSDDYIKYIAAMFNMTSVATITNDMVVDRFYTNNLPELLKRKGSFDSFLNTYLLITESKNLLNMYEIWHDKTIDVSAPSSYDSIKSYCTANSVAYNEFLFNQQYNDIKTSGAGEKYYEYSIPYPEYDSMVCSPHIRAEIDLSTEPFGSTEVIDYTTCSLIKTKFDEIKPVSRYLDYSYVIKLPTNFTGHKVELYDGKKYQKVYTQCVNPVFSPLVDCFIYRENMAMFSNFNIKHGLDTNEILVQCYRYSEETQILTKIVPKSVLATSRNDIYIETNKKEDGFLYVFIATLNVGHINDTYTQFPSGSSSYVVSAGYIENLEHIQINNEQVYPMSYVLDYVGNTRTISFDEISLDEISETNLMGDVSHTITGSIGTQTHTITHSLATQALIVNVFEKNPDNSLKKIEPAEINIVDETVVTISLSTTISKDFLVTLRAIATELNVFVTDVIDVVNNVSIGYNENTKMNDDHVISPYQVNVDYAVKSIETVYPTVPETTFYIKVIIKALKDIYITEVSINDISLKDLFYTQCSKINMLKNQYMTFFYTIKGELNE